MRRLARGLRRRKQWPLASHRDAYTGATFVHADATNSHTGSNSHANSHAGSNSYAHTAAGHAAAFGGRF